MILRTFVEDPALFRNYFPRGLESWQPWLVFLKVISGEPLASPEEMALFEECTGLTQVPSPNSIKEVFVICGRRSGKSTMTAILAAAFAMAGDWQQYLSPGETARVFIISPTMKQGEIIKNYLEAIFNLNHGLKKLVKKMTADSIELVNNVTIEIKSANWRSTRGFSVGILIMEELAFWRFESDSANPDKEIYTAIRPSMTTIKNSLTIGISTPLLRSGLLYEKYERNFGKPGKVLIWRSPTWRMNLSLNETELRDEFGEELGLSEFESEYAANWRSDLEGYLPLEIIDNAIVPGRQYLPPKPGTQYFGFCDSAEGLSKTGDSMTFAVSHFENNKYVLDSLLSFPPPFNPKTVIQTIIESCRQYKILSITQDRVSIGWIAAELRQYGISVEVSQWDKSKIYELFSVLMNARSVELLDDNKTRKQMLNLVKTVRSGGLVKIDIPRGGHEDEINSVAGSIVTCSQKPRWLTKAERDARINAIVKVPSRARQIYDSMKTDSERMDDRMASARDEFEKDFMKEGAGIPDRKTPNPWER
jgi:hypothetical protein